MTIDYIKKLFIVELVKASQLSNGKKEHKKNLKMHTICDSYDHYKIKENIYFNQRLIYVLDIDKINEDKSYLQLFAAECAKVLNEELNKV